MPASNWFSASNSNSGLAAMTTVFPALCSGNTAGPIHTAATPSIRPSNTLLPMEFAGLGVQATHHAGIVRHEEQIPDDQLRRAFGHGLSGLPDDVAVGHVALAVRPDGHQRIPAVARADVNHPVVKQRPAAGVHSAVPHPPDYLAVFGIVGNRFRRGGADDLRFSIHDKSPGRWNRLFCGRRCPCRS